MTDKLPESPKGSALADSKETIAAANALIQWLNSQEIGGKTAERVLSRTLAVLFEQRLRGPQEPYAVHKAIEAFTFNLVNDTNLQLYHKRRTR